jgi:hypothetical protein
MHALHSFIYRYIGDHHFGILATRLLRSSPKVVPNTRPSSSAGFSELGIVDDVTGLVVKSHIKLSVIGGTTCAEVAAIVNPITGHTLVMASDNQFYGPVHLDAVDLWTGTIVRVITIPGAVEYNGLPTMAVDVPTHHVFVASPIDNTVTMFDGTQL